MLPQKEATTDIYKTITNQIEESINENNKGLLNGCMGTSILLYKLERRHKTIDVNMSADSLLDSSLNCSELKSTEFANGLSGIGWGIENLIAERFIEGDRNDILSDEANSLNVEKCTKG